MPLLETTEEPASLVGERGRIEVGCGGRVDHLAIGDELAGGGRIGQAARDDQQVTRVDKTRLRDRLGGGDFLRPDTETHRNDAQGIGCLGVIQDWRGVYHIDLGCESGGGQLV